LTLFLIVFESLKCFQVQARNLSRPERSEVYIALIGFLHVLILRFRVENM
jgi:hypothetical protein